MFLVGVFYLWLFTLWLNCIKPEYMQLVINWYRFLTGQCQNIDQLLDKQCWDQYLIHFNIPPSITFKKRSYQYMASSRPRRQPPKKVSLRRRQEQESYLEGEGPCLDLSGSEIMLSPSQKVVNLQLTATYYDTVSGFCLISCVGKKCCQH